MNKKQTLITRYLAGETDLAEERELRSLLSSGTKEERNLLLMLEGSAPTVENVAEADSSAEYFRVVRSRRVRRAVGALAVAAGLVAAFILTINPFQRGNLPMVQAGLPVDTMVNHLPDTAPAHVKDSLSLEKIHPVPVHAPLLRASAGPAPVKAAAPAPSARPDSTDRKRLYEEELCKVEEELQDMMMLEDLLAEINEYIAREKETANILAL